MTAEPRGSYEDRGDGWQARQTPCHFTLGNPADQSGLRQSGTSTLNTHKRNNTTVTLPVNELKLCGGKGLLTR